MKLLSGINQLIEVFSFSTKMVSIRSITDMEILTKTIPHNVYFIVQYHLFLHKKIQGLYFSEYNIQWNVGHSIFVVVVVFTWSWNSTSFWGLTC